MYPEHQAEEQAHLRCASLQGLVMPPRVAPLQVVVIPITTSSMESAARTQLATATADVVAALRAAGVRCTCDDRDHYRPGWKYNHWEVQVRRPRLNSILKLCTYIPKHIH